ncbi:vesicle transport protein GOT1B [Vombatus ursinus]|nr:vesicle transport protein GOT1B [Vombatus ursinus]
MGEKGGHRGPVKAPRLLTQRTSPQESKAASSPLPFSPPDRKQQGPAWTQRPASPPQVSYSPSGAQASFPPPEVFFSAKRDGAQSLARPLHVITKEKHQSVLEIKTFILCYLNPVIFITEIGMGLTGFGVFFLFFGMILFFDKALLAIGNVLFVAGLAFVIGLERTFRFFFQKHKVKATGFFLGGVFVVLIGWPLIGMILEIYGFFLLFRGFFPVVVGFIRRVPVLGSLLNLPGIRSLVDKVGESNNMV